MNEIRPMGSVLQCDLDGYLVFRPDPTRLQPKWKALLDQVVSVYETRFGPNLRSVYVRGSVAKGEAVDGISDIDTLALVKDGEEEIMPKWCEDQLKALRKKHRFCTGIEIIVLPPLSLLHVNPPKTVNPWKKLIKTQALCVYGEDIAPSIPRQRPDFNMAGHIFALSSDLPKTPEELAQYSARKCTWLMKRIVRSGFELVMDREKTFTRDLYPCYAAFIKYHPEWEPQMWLALELAVFPQPEKVEPVVSTLGKWLADQGQDWKWALETHGPCAPLD